MGMELVVEKQTELKEMQFRTKSFNDQNVYVFHATPVVFLLNT